ncbi:MAG: HK97 family phage prohead protease [Microthrixaceae bacterium]|nr:HK97 family phage prohead protease [Microthrixaceae bacterium]
MNDLRGIPAEVLGRMAPVLGDDAPGFGARFGFDQVTRGGIAEARTFKALGAERRAADDEASDTVDVVGHPVMYDRAYRVGGSYGWDETIAAGALTKSLKDGDRVVFLANHDSSSALGFPVAATYSGDLTLTDGRDSLRCELTLTRGANVVADMLADGITAGRIDSMSWAFRVIRQEWNGDYTERTIREAQIFDVSAVTYPANPEATIAERAAEIERSKRMSLADLDRELDFLTMSRR